MTGQMLAFDKHMNLVLADTEEFRRVKRKQNKFAAPGSETTSQTIETEEKRTLGLTIVRGAHIISLSVESPPPADPSARLGKNAPSGIPSALASGPGVARPAGRGAAPPSLAVRFLISSSLTHSLTPVGPCCWCWRWSFPRFPWLSWRPWFLWRPRWWYASLPSISE
jgi:small nuclear ribonucleoprotein (snRNP)-like protein